MATATPRIAPDHAREPASFPGAFAYDHTDIPAGITLHEYRRQRAAGAREAKRARRAARRQRIVGLIASPRLPLRGSSRTVEEER